MTATEREKYAEILARHLGVPVDTITKELWLNARSEVIDALLEARDLARREALEDLKKWLSLEGDDRARYAVERYISQPSPETKSAGAESSNEPFTDGRGAAEVASASVPAEPDKYCTTRNDGECVSTDPRCMHNQPEPSDTEAWKRVPVDAGMLIEATDKAWGSRIIAVAIERAARAKLVEK